MKREYREKVALLIGTIPFVAKETGFALKGGTAINLFYRNMPRLSIDIDLTYIENDEREIAYQRIHEALYRIASDLRRYDFSVTIQGSNAEKKIIVSNGTASIKVEPNYTIRGCLYPPSVYGVCEKAEREYGYAEMQIISLPELVGGKMCAALDRQHPRDLFDINGFLNDSERNESIIKGFIAMLLSHNRPIHELLNPQEKDRSEVLQKEFAGMTDTKFSIQDHSRSLRALVQFIQNGIHPYKQFLLDFVSLKTDFSQLESPGIERLPAIRWKLRNLEILRERNPVKFDEQYRALEELFSGL